MQISYPGALIVEDEVFIVLDLEDALSDIGLAVAATLSSNAAALEWLRQNRPSVAIIDYRLKDGTSEPLAEALRLAKIPTVVCSGNVYDPRIHEAEFGSFQWIGKPMETGALEAAIERAMRDRM